MNDVITKCSGIRNPEARFQGGVVVFYIDSKGITESQNSCFPWTPNILCCCTRRYIYCVHAHTQPCVVFPMAYGGLEPISKIRDLGIYLPGTIEVKDSEESEDGRFDQVCVNNMIVRAA